MTSNNGLCDQQIEEMLGINIARERRKEREEAKDLPAENLFAQFNTTNSLAAARVNLADGRSDLLAQ